MARYFLKFCDGVLRVGLAALVTAIIVDFILQPEYLLLKQSHPHATWLPIVMWAVSILLYGILLCLGYKGGRWIPIHLYNQYKICFLKHYDRVTLEVPHVGETYHGRLLRFRCHKEKREYLRHLRERELFQLNFLARVTFWLTGNKLTLVDLGAGVYAHVPSYCIRMA